VDDVADTVHNRDKTNIVGVVVVLGNSGEGVDEDLGVTITTEARGHGIASSALDSLSGSEELTNQLATKLGSMESKAHLVGVDLGHELGALLNVLIKLLLQANLGLINKRLGRVGSTKLSNILSTKDVSALDVQELSQNGLLLDARTF
jgi:hypothetical protein